MEIVKLWEFPVPTTCLYNAGIKLYYYDAEATIKFDYYDQDDNDKIYNGAIVFNSVMCHRHSSERFTKSLVNAYDQLVQINNSVWLEELKKLNESDFKFWNLKHFVIYFDSYGLYEFIAEDFKILNIQLGELEGRELG